MDALREVFGEFYPVSEASDPYVRRLAADLGPPDKVYYYYRSALFPDGKRYFVEGVVALKDPDTVEKLYAFALALMEKVMARHLRRLVQAAVDQLYAQDFPLCEEA